MIYNLLKRKTFLNLDVHNLDFFPRFFRFLTQSPELSKSTPKQFLNIKICLPSVFLKQSFFKSFFRTFVGRFNLMVHLIRWQSIAMFSWQVRTWFKLMCKNRLKIIMALILFVISTNSYTFILIVLFRLFSLCFF